MLRGTRAISIIIGLVGLFMFWKLFGALHMELTSQILGAFISVGLVALIIIFQPEIRRVGWHWGGAFINRYSARFTVSGFIFQGDIQP